VPSLRAFARATDCRLVVTQPDRPGGRGQRLQPTPVKQVARELGIDTYEPEHLREALETLRAVRADLFAVASYGKIVSRPILELPRLGALNVHPSLLPRYRGATPLQAQLRDGVTTGGVTIILMDSGMDTGDVVVQQSSPIGPSETYGELHDRFAALGAELLARACALALEGKLERTPQATLADPEAIAKTLTRPLQKTGLELDWGASGAGIVNFVRSLAPAPGARADLGGERVKVLRATRELDWTMIADPNVAPGTLLAASADAALVKCGDGVVAVERLVPPNRGPVDGASFARAHIAKRLSE
jgi:methionyl-tRNA formyltransferase